MSLSIHHIPDDEHSSVATKPSLVFLHGWGFDHHIWHPLVDKMSHHDYPGDYYLVDLPGFGQSPMMDWDAFKTALMTQCPGQWILIGWSLGGLLATRLALEIPQRVTRLINVASIPRFTAS